MSFLPLKPSSFSTASSTGQAVAVPAGLAGHVVAAHGAEAGEDVLEDAGLDVVGAGHAVGGRRALVEHPLGAALGLLQALGEDLAARARSRARRARGRAGRPGRAPGGTAAVVIGELPPADCLPSVGGTRAVLRAPAVPPSLAAGRCAPVSPLIGVAMPGLLGRGWLAAAFFRRLRGDLHVALAPGLSPSPGRSWLRTTLLVPIHAFRCAQCTGPRRTAADRFSGARGHGARRARREARGLTRMARRPRFASRDGPARRITGRGAGHNGCRLATWHARGGRIGRRAPLPRGSESIYRPSTIREQDHNM